VKHRPDWSRAEIGLVLQGGGALGAYEWGAIDALLTMMQKTIDLGKDIALKVVTGVSIGAINGACIVGAKDWADGRQRLSDLWKDLTLETPIPAWIDHSFRFQGFAPARDLSLFGLPGFYHPRTDYWRMPHWNSFYDTAPLEETLRKHISFEHIDGNTTDFVVTAVDVESGRLQRFRNRHSSAAGESKKRRQRPPIQDHVVVRFQPRHLMASGSLAPQFPWIDIGGRHFWDGGLVDNTPLGDAIDSFSGDDSVFRVVVVMNLYPLSALKPRNIFDVFDRVHELSYGNRLRQDGETAHRINEMVATIELLAKEVDREKIDSNPLLHDCVAKALRYKIAEIVDVDFQINDDGTEDQTDDSHGLRDFTPATIESRRCRGSERAIAALKPVFEEFLKTPFNVRFADGKTLCQ
jgi:predicted acylesterase/phospholipase RssA